jgi:hypothetical protein
MYVYRHWHQALPYFIILSGLWVGQKFKPATYDVIIAVFAIEAGGLMLWFYLIVAGIMYQAYITGWGERKGKAGEAQEETRDPALTPDFIPTKRALMQTHAQVVTAPKIDAEQKVARTLIDQRNHNMKVDLTETFWIKRGNFEGSRDQFVAMKDKWIKHGVIYKTGDRKNAPHDVKDWRRVRLIAGGNPLPD